MANDSHNKAPIIMPMHVLLVLAIGVCGFFFWLGIVLVRLWFYKGALGPAPERFIIIPFHRRRAPQQDFEAQGGNRLTVLPEAAHLANPSVSASPDYSAMPEASPHLGVVPTITVQDADNEHDTAFTNAFEDPSKVRAYIAEEHRISRLPAFDQDDCGDGSEFPMVPYATKSVEKEAQHGLEGTLTYLQLGLRKHNSTGHWLTIDITYLEQHEARASLIDQKLTECIQVKPEGEAACEELLATVAQNLCIKMPDHFSTKMKHHRKHIRNDLICEEYTLARPFDRHPLEICARIVTEDFHIFIKDEFTLQWYLQAGAALFPSGWALRNSIGKSLPSIINDKNHPMPQWSSLPDILALPYTPSTLYTRTSTFIQTRAPGPPSRTLHILRPVDFFSGTMASLEPQNLFVRREMQTFRVLPVSGAVVMTTKTELGRLLDVESRRERRALMAEIGGWGEEEARLKGRDLWMTSVRAWCVGGEVWCDDRTVV